VKDWTFGGNVSDLGQLREQFLTRFIYNGGTQDTLNDEWQRYRDNDNHEFKDGRFALVARVPRGNEERADRKAHAALALERRVTGMSRAT